MPSSSVHPNVSYHALSLQSTKQSLQTLNPRKQEDVTSRHVTSCHIASRHITSRHVTSLRPKELTRFLEEVPGHVVLTGAARAPAHFRRAALPGAAATATRPRRRSAQRLHCHCVSCLTWVQANSEANSFKVKVAKLLLFLNNFRMAFCIDSTTTAFTSQLPKAPPILG